MTVIGCTGGIGSGKTTVCALLRERGAHIVDADDISRRLSARGGPSYRPIIDAFGPEIIRDDGEIDRPRLAAIVFRDPSLLDRLESIVHPYVEREVTDEIAEHRDRVVVVDHPLLVETDGRARFGLEGILVVDAPIDIALERLVRIRRMDPEDARLRIAAQMSREERLRRADFIIMNMGNLKELSLMVDNAWDWIGTLGGSG